MIIFLSADFLTLSSLSDSFRNKPESFSSSVPSIPNPFPELCSPSKSPVLARAPGDKHVSSLWCCDTSPSIYFIPIWIPNRQ